MPQPAPNDAAYLAIIRQALTVCQRYKPKFGGGKESGYSLSEFRQLYQQDPFYSWFGLDSPLVYTAHKAAGGMTSVYRQLGIACERVFRAIVSDQLGLTDEQSRWSYTVPRQSGKDRKLTLDARILASAVSAPGRSRTVAQWLKNAAAHVRVPTKAAKGLEGAVFEVRQGYKSKDSKRQNADVANAANAYAHGYLPAVVLLSTQIDSDVADRYVASQWLLLRGTLNGTSVDSTYVFCRDVLGYDLAAFFRRNSPKLKKELAQTLKHLLS